VGKQVIVRKNKVRGRGRVSEVPRNMGTSTIWSLGEVQNDIPHILENGAMVLKQEECVDISRGGESGKLMD